MKTYKIKIKKSPVSTTMAYGGQTNYSLDTGGRFSHRDFSEGDYDYTASPLNTTLKEVSKDEANIEAELGESIVGDFQNNGTIQHLKVGGKKHSQGGTHLQVPDDAFVFSDTPALKMQGSELTAFGKSEKSSKKYTPAELAKQYDINKYQQIIDDPNADSMKKKTAQLMLSNYNKKLSQLSLVQEAKKGFHNGIPDMAIPYLQTMSDMAEGAIEGEGEGAMMKFGGEFKDGGKVNPFDIDPYKGGKTRKGTITPTGKNNAFNRGKDYLETWEGLIPGISKLTNAEAQSRIYDFTLENNPEAIKGMWRGYGNTAKGLRDKATNIAPGGRFTDEQLNDPEVLQKMKSAYSDGYFGVRQLDPQGRPQGVTPPAIVPVPTPPVPPIQVQPPTAPPVTPSGPTPGDFNPTGSRDVFDYMTPDKLNFMAGVRTRANINKYMPWEAPVTAQTVDPTFYDPNRELANNNEQAAAQQTYNAMFSGPQSLQARNSAVAGQAAGNAADILSRYNNQNVGVANQFAGVNADIMNRLTDAEAQRATRLFDKTTVVNQQYDNSIAAADNQILKAGINAWDNRSQVSMVNDTNPYYYVDPATGRMTFRKGMDRDVLLGRRPEESNTGTWRQYYDAAIKEGRNASSAESYANDMMKGGKTTYTDKNNDGAWDAVKAQTSRYNGITGPRG